MTSKRNKIYAPLILALQQALGFQWPQEPQVSQLALPCLLAQGVHQYPAHKYMCALGVYSAQQHTLGPSEPLIPCSPFSPDSPYSRKIKIIVLLKTLEEWTDRQMNRQTDRQTDGRTDGRTDRQTDRQTMHSPSLLLLHQHH